MAGTELTDAALAAALRDGAPAVVALFGTATDAERARLRPAVEAAERETAPSAGPAVAAAVLATYPAAKVAARHAAGRRRAGAEVPDDVVVGALRPRGAPFGTALARAVLRRERPAWDFVRPLVRAGVLDPAVDDDAYVRAMARGLLGPAPDAPYRGVLADPSLLDREVWRLFEVPGALGPSTAPWHDALLRLAAEGRLDRGRLLDATLAALGADLRPGQLGWLAAFWAGLAPADDEVRPRSGSVTALLASPEPAVVKVALPLARRLVEAGDADPDAVAGLLRHPLGGSRKNLALTALGLLEEMLGRAAACGDGARVERLLGAACAGLGNDRADVAERALALVRRHTAGAVPEAVRAELRRRVDEAPPTLRRAVADLAGEPHRAAATVPHPRPGDVPAPVQPGPWAGVTGERRLAPVEDLEELVALFAAALDGRGSADDAERALGAVVRRAGERPAGFADLVRPVRERAATLLEVTGAAGAPVELARVVAAWVDGRPPRPAGDPAAPEPRSGLRTLVSGLLGRAQAAKPPPPRSASPTPGAFLRGRVAEVVAALAAGSPATALSEPTHRGGRLDPEALAARRTGRWRDGLGPYDRRQAALRLPIGHDWPPPLRLDVADAGAARPGDPSAVRFVRDTPPDGAAPDALVVAAERYFRLAGAERVSTSAFRPFWDVVADGLGTRLAVTTFAGRPDVPAAMAAVGLAERARQAAVHWVDPDPMIEALLDEAVPLDGATAALLALALTGDPGQRAAGVRAAVAAVGDGRFDPGALARATAALHRADVLVLTRLAHPVGEVAAAGPLHLLRAQQYLLALVEALGGHAAGLHGPLETLARLSAGGIVVSEPAGRVLRWLAERSSQAGKAAATVVANAVA